MKNQTLNEVQAKAFASLTDATQTTIKTNQYGKLYSECSQEFGYVGLAGKQNAIFEAIKYLAMANDYIPNIDYQSILSNLADIGASLITWDEYEV